MDHSENINVVSPEQAGPPPPDAHGSDADERELQANAPPVNVTPKAAQKIREALVRENVAGGLRLGVQGGGCSGLSYLFKLDAKPRPNDNVLTFPASGGGDVQVYVDPKSVTYLQGMTLDWKDSLIHSGFVFENPNAKKSCGCGTSFST